MKMYYVLWINLFVQICLCSGVGHEYLSEEDAQMNMIVSNPGWQDIAELISNKYIVEVLFNPTPSEKAMRRVLLDRRGNASLVLSDLYATVIYELSDCFISIAFNFKELEYAKHRHVHFMTLVQSLNMFRPLRQCMLNALNYFDSYYPAREILQDMEVTYKKFNNLLSHKMYRNTESTLTYLHYENFEQVQEYHTGINNRRDLINIPMLGLFVKPYFDELKTLTNSPEDFNFLDSSHPVMKRKIEEGVEKFCSNFGF